MKSLSNPFFQERDVAIQLAQLQNELQIETEKKIMKSSSAEVIRRLKKDENVL